MTVRCAAFVAMLAGCNQIGAADIQGDSESSNCTAPNASCSQNDCCDGMTCQGGFCVPVPPVVSGEATCGGGNPHCTTVPNTATPVTVAQVLAAPPSAQGGALPPAGTYYLTSAEVFTGPDGGTELAGKPYAETVVLSGGAGGESIEQAIEDDGCAGAFVGILMLDATTDGALDLVANACPNDGARRVYGYTLLTGPSTTLTLIETGGLVMTYTLQP